MKSLENVEFKAEISKEKLVKWRRHLHKYPELSFQEEKTSQFVFDTLQSFGNLELSRPTKYSVMARLVGGKPGKTLAIRADMDALPIVEENRFKFASTVPGVMHACGHDGHTAILLGAAEILAKHKNEISGEIRFLFQHAEEQYPGGAEEMVQAGVMNGVDYVIGLHLMSGLEVGKIGIVYGPMMAAPDAFHITIKGKGGHAAHPEDTVDSIAIGAQIITNLQHIVSRKTNAFAQRVLSVTQFHAGTADNIIPEIADIVGTVRCFDEQLRYDAEVRIEQIVKGICEAHGASYSCHYRYGYRPVINHDAVTKVVEQTAIEEYGNESISYIKPSMGGEDFSAFLQKTDGCFFKIGSGSVDSESTLPHHHPRFTIDEESLVIGVNMFLNAACNLLSKE
ncbi:amidohydrolase [Bacillus sp. AFS029533]|uniref:amidohydrolase n=1 Tax=Bacillus sp. AFS029533 TaxID=2033494 RepID=UPI000BFE1B70|nr:amidohydrolase [Bacillus sp. AFS029533]PGZ93377.1 N-acyl-L-amino acid amidohydrolase [Bacillus sp. AFS029533]